MLQLRGLPRTYWILWTGALINRLGGFVMPLLALYLTGQRGLSVEQAGLIVSLLGAGSLTAGPVGGFLADRIGRRRTLILALVTGSLAMLHLGFAQAPAHIAAAAFLLGLFGDLYRPAVSAAIADLVPPEDRVRAFGFLYWAVNLGFATAAALGGALAEHGWLLLFIVDAATTLLYAGVVYFKIPETRPAETVQEKRPLPWAPLADLRFVVFVFLIMLLWLQFHQAFVTLPIDLRARGLAPGKYGAVIAINGVLIVALQPLALRTLGGVSRHRVLAAAGLFVGVGFGLTGVMHSVPGFAFSIAVWTVGEIIMSGVAPASVADAAPPAQRGAYQGFFQMGAGSAALLAPILGSQVLGKYGSAALWLSCLGVGVASSIGQLLLGPLRRLQLSEAPAGGARAPAPPQAPPA